MIYFCFSCRKSQVAYDKCVFDKFGQERPELGYFSKVRVHKTNRPRPVRELPMPEPTPDPPNPDDQPIPEFYKKHGYRLSDFPK